MHDTIHTAQDVWKTMRAALCCDVSYDSKILKSLVDGVFTYDGLRTRLHFFPRNVQNVVINYSNACRKYEKDHYKTSALADRHLDGNRPYLS